MAITGAGAAPAAATMTGAQPGPKRSRASVILVGTAGGPILTASSRKGVCTAITVGDAVYIIDLGHGAHTNFHAAGLSGPGDSQAFSRFRGIFFTHMHTDHVVEWPAVYATGLTNTSGAVPPSPIPVFGPADRAQMPRLNPPDRPEPTPYNPERPMPGIVGMTEYLTQAFAHDLNDRARDNNGLPLSTLFDVRGIDLPPGWETDATGVPPRLVDVAPLQVFEDDRVRVTATLVDHRPTAPAFGFRFDTEDGSVVISGDTAPSDNLIALAQGADVLVHEVIDTEYVDRLVAQLDERLREPVREHLLASHTTIEQVGPIAERAGVRHLALSHLVPATVSKGRLQKAGRGFSGKLHAADDLHEIPLRP